MESEKTLISRNTLTERWDFESPSTIINYEHQGILTRNPNFKAPKYYIEEVLKIESLKEINPLSPLERRRLERRVEELENEVSVLRDKLTNIKVLLG
ncbi:MAG: transcription factor [Clostridium sulfidigenes]|uniref:Transcription factor n=1 Tax=Clostridium sulfidigenes TaxID=318464 RepID=A0A927WFG2_9CLOT|nr:transcription factor [Clostridium sulfidigenes]